MFLREGSRHRAKVSAAVVAIVVASGVVFGTAQAADRSKPVQSNGVELPREVLPWRWNTEQRAAVMLERARHALRSGKRADAVRELNELLRRYPRTHAADDGELALAKLRRSQAGRANRRGLGMPQHPSDDGHLAPHPPTDPVAGWQAVVRQKPLDLREALIEAAGDRVFFADGSARLSKRAMTTLKRQARWLKGRPHIRVRVVGHADDQGSTERNMRLSHDRAVAVRRRLIAYGVSPKRVRLFSHGKGRPIAICTVTTCGAQNRRVVTEIRATRQAKANYR